MADTISNDLRKRIIDHVASRFSRREAAKHFDVVASTAINIVAHHDKTGSIAPTVSVG